MPIGAIHHDTVNATSLKTTLIIANAVRDIKDDSVWSTFSHHKNSASSLDNHEKIYTLRQMIPLHYYFYWPPVPCALLLLLLLPLGSGRLGAAAGSAVDARSEAGDARGEAPGPPGPPPAGRRGFLLVSSGQEHRGGADWPRRLFRGRGWERRFWGGLGLAGEPQVLKATHRGAQPAGAWQERVVVRTTEKKSEEHWGSSSLDISAEQRASIFCLLKLKSS